MYSHYGLAEGIFSRLKKMVVPSDVFIVLILRRKNCTSGRTHKKVLLFHIKFFSQPHNKRSQIPKMQQTSLTVLEKWKKWYSSKWVSQALIHKYNTSQGHKQGVHSVQKKALRLIFQENSFQFNKQNYLLMHRTSMGTKNDISFCKHLHGWNWNANPQ